MMPLPLDKNPLIGMTDAVPAVPVTPSSILKRAQEREFPSDTMGIANRIIELSNDPEQMHQVLDALGEPFDEHAPQAAQDLRMTMANTIGFLASKAPRSTLPAPGLDPIAPTQAEVRKFERYVNAIQDPVSLISDATKGVLTPEAIEAVKTVYPNVFSSIQSQIADRMHNAKNISYQRRMQISALLGQDMTGTLNPKMGLMAQSIYATPPAGQPQQQMKSFQAKAINPERQAWSDAQPKGMAARAEGRGSPF